MSGLRSRQDAEQDERDRLAPYAQCSADSSGRVYAEDDVYWVDSAADDSDAGTKLTTAGQRGLIFKRTPFEITMYPGITRLDFLAVSGSVALTVTGT